MQLSTYDVIVVNSSAGKDSQAMLDYMVELADLEGVRDRLVVVHADLGRMEWGGTPELAEEQADYYGLRFLKVSRPQGDLLDEIRQRGKFPDSARRFCTSHHKRDQVAKLFTQLAREVTAATGKRQPRILNCMGLRAQESPARAKKPEFAHSPRSSSGRRHVDDWLPIFNWTITQVWQRIRSAGTPVHPIYSQGMPRLSCCFCVLASRGALVRAAQLNPELAEEIRDVEEEIGHSFTAKRSMAQIIEEASTASTVTVTDWSA